MIDITCPSCDGAHRASRDHAGHWAMCPVTSAWFLIPFTTWEVQTVSSQPRPVLHSFGLFRPRSFYEMDWGTTCGRVLTTEAEWEGCHDLVDLLHCALKEAPPQKLRLFAAACAREVLHLTNKEPSIRSVEAAEAWSYGLIDDAKLKQAELRAWSVWMNGGTEVERAARACAVEDVHEAVFTTSLAARAVMIFTTCQDRRREWEKSFYPSWLEKGRSASPADQQEMLVWKEQWEKELTRDVISLTEVRLKKILLDVLGNPFRPVRLPKTWLGLHESTVVKMAQVIYQNQSFEDMPILGDALEDADCPVESILNHCREHPVHSRGCHVLHAILNQS